MTRARLTSAELREQGRLAERADVLAWLGTKGGAAARRGERGDETATMLAQRLVALSGDIEACLHIGEASHG